MTDLDICKRIAKITGVSFVEFSSFIVRESIFTFTSSIRCCSKNDYIRGLESMQFNPLKDDALCLSLIKEFKPESIWWDGFEWCIRITPEQLLSKSTHFNRAFCLALIEFKDNE